MMTTAHHPLVAALERLGMAPKQAAAAGGLHSTSTTRRQAAVWLHRHGGAGGTAVRGDFAQWLHHCGFGPGGDY